MTANTQQEDEVTRILTSELSSQLVHEMKTASGQDSRIEEELKEKTEQISTIQNYLKNEISNIQGIVEGNGRLKREMEVMQGKMR